MQHYYAIAERGRGGGWVLTFPGSAGRSFAENVDQIVQQAQVWLASAGMHGGTLPCSIEDGAMPPTNLAEYQHPLVVVIQFEPVPTEQVA
jgi:hypothetical protein